MSDASMELVSGGVDSNLVVIEVAKYSEMIFNYSQQIFLVNIQNMMMPFQLSFELDLELKDYGFNPEYFKRLR